MNHIVNHETRPVRTQAATDTSIAHAFELLRIISVLARARGAQRSEVAVVVLWCVHVTTLLVQQMAASMHFTC